MKKHKQFRPYAKLTSSLPSHNIADCGFDRFEKESTKPIIKQMGGIKIRLKTMVSALKELYDDSKLWKDLCKDNPFLKMDKKTK